MDNSDTLFSIPHAEQPDGAYWLVARIERDGRIIGYMLGFVCERRGEGRFSLPICAVIALAKMGKIKGVAVECGELVSTVSSTPTSASNSSPLHKLPGGDDAIARYATAHYTAHKHPNKEEYWGRINSPTTPILLIIGTYRNEKDGLLGYKAYSPDTLDEYSISLGETHQIMPNYRVFDYLGEQEVKRGLSDWCWRLYLDSDHEAMEKLPREYLSGSGVGVGVNNDNDNDNDYKSGCKPPSGGHLERDNLFEIWERAQIYESALKHVVTGLAELFVGVVEPGMDGGGEDDEEDGGAGGQRNGESLDTR